MALIKNIVQKDGVLTSYHRILFVNSVINSHVSIAVLSYINEEGRNKEREQLPSIVISPYKSPVTYETDYVENMTIQDAYRYLKTIPQFEGAEDV